IRVESKRVSCIYGSLSGLIFQMCYTSMWAIKFRFLFGILGVTIALSCLLFYYTRLCHLNFGKIDKSGKGLKYYLEFDPELKDEYEYSKLNIVDNDESHSGIYYGIVRYCEFIKTLPNFLKEWLINDQKQRTSKTGSNDPKVIIL
ncbi:1932_t:CDS:2, partial [Funneliformis mosseae]